MYAVVSYYNYRKEVSFTILKIFNSLDKAKDTALSMAKDEFGDEITDEVLEKWVDVKGEVINGYTTNDGFGEYVYTVVEIPDVE